MHNKACQLFFVKIGIIYHITISRIEFIYYIIKIKHRVSAITQISYNPAITLVQRIFRHCKKQLPVLLKCVICSKQTTAVVIRTYNRRSLRQSRYYAVSELKIVRITRRIRQKFGYDCSAVVGYLFSEPE